MTKCTTARAHKLFLLVGNAPGVAQESSRDRCLDIFLNYISMLRNIDCPLSRADPSALALEMLPESPRKVPVIVAWTYF